MMKTPIELLMLSLTALILLSLVGCSDEDSASPGDRISPDAVTDLRVESVTGSVVTLTWTAPGDDGDTGTASKYDIRYSSDPITEANWEACTQATTEPEPSASGNEQSVTIDTGGTGNIYFALKTADEASNWSSLSNVVTAAVGVGFVIRQLTTEGSNEDPCLDDGFVVWVHWNADDGDEIYIANLESVAPNPTRLTDNGGEKARPNNHGSERIVWEGREGSSYDWEIWIYNKYTTPRFSQFTHNDIPDHYPDLSGGGNFAWIQGYIMYEEVHYWTENLHLESVISDGCCPVSKWSNGDLSAEHGMAVWGSYDRYGQEGYKIHLWDGEATDITDTLEGGSNFSLYEGNIAYDYGASPGGYIRYWDGSTVREVGKGAHSSLYNGAIAYEVWTANDWEIRYWDGTTIHEITNNDYDDMQPSLHGSIIAWVGRPPGSSYQIFYVDVAE